MLSVRHTNVERPHAVGDDELCQVAGEVLRRGGGAAVAGREHPPPAVIAVQQQLAGPGNCRPVKLPQKGPGLFEELCNRSSGSFSSGLRNHAQRGLRRLEENGLGNRQGIVAGALALSDLVGQHLRHLFSHPQGFPAHSHAIGAGEETDRDRARDRTIGSRMIGVSPV